MDVFDGSELLQEHRLRPTLARLSVLQLFKDEQAYTPEQVYRALVRQGGDVSLATTYRVLAQFVETGLLGRQQLDNGPGRYFLPTSKPCEHMLCTECGVLLPMPGPEIGSLLKQLAAKQGYQLAEYEVVMQGQCTACAQKSAESAKQHHRRSDRSGRSSRTAAYTPRAAAK